ncbi:helix-turn-helix domain-containing protein [Allosphingosinicella flava]|uniref:Helix-turn-helix domain-containing protein n=2 Tax=Allosphingosinicella flava TaxID=2771430 RepID=A0A7T2GKK0_9SPHN|nr:helix-turn-helix domain-containing protein [Sphingosinicella flava]
MKHPILYHNVQALLRRLKEDQTVFADRLGVSQGTVSRWGILSVPRGSALTDLADLAGVTPKEFLKQKLSEEAPVKNLPPGPGITLPNEDVLTEVFAGLLETIDVDPDQDGRAQKLAKSFPAALQFASNPPKGRAALRKKVREASARDGGEDRPLQSR